jgi:hypothetical protein
MNFGSQKFLTAAFLGSMPDTKTKKYNINIVINRLSYNINIVLA